jgi:hypothetical protein
MSFSAKSTRTSIVDAILQTKPGAKVLFVVGASHLEDDQVPSADWIQSLLRRRGISALPILAMNADAADWSVIARAAHTIREAGLAKQAFYVPAPGSHPGLQGILNLPESTAFFWLPNPVAAAKRWIRAIAARMRR